MSHRILARLGSASVITALLLGLMAMPAAAAGTNRWVDDDIVAGDGPDQCDGASYTSIQDAIDDSSAGDWVYVCPGTYVETLTIQSGVKVMARPLFQAKISAPLLGPIYVVDMIGNNSLLRGFVIQIPAGESAPTLGPTIDACHKYDAAILVTGADAQVRNNRISAVDGQTLGGPCGYDYGIVVGQHLDSATARVTFNWVTDFKRGGILVEDADSYAFVRRNTVRFLHENECPIYSISCAITVRPSVNDAFALSFGIGVESGARADIIRNAVASGPNACSTGPSYSCSPGSTPTMNDGISLTGLDGTETTDIHHNVVRRTLGGIVTREDADGAVIHDNWVYDSHYGYQVGGDNDEWYANHTSGNDYGVSVGPNGSGNNFHDNDFRGNPGTDCYDDSSGGGTANTANTWTNNLGNTEFPVGICIADSV